MKTCDCCGKDCCKRVPVVLPDGSIADVGTSCAKKYKRAKRSDLFKSLYNRAIVRNVSEDNEPCCKKVQIVRGDVHYIDWHGPICAVDIKELEECEFTTKEDKVTCKECLRLLSITDKSYFKIINEESKLPKEIYRIAKKYKIELKEVNEDFLKKSNLSRLDFLDKSISYGKVALIGIYKDQELKELSFFHELSHIINKKEYNSIFEMESDLWGLTFVLAKKNGFNFSAKASKWAIDQLSTYCDKEYMAHFLTFDNSSSKEKGKGDCFGWALKNMQDGDVLVHAIVNPIGRLGNPYWHAWVERDGKILDWQGQVAGQYPPLPIDKFYAVYRPVDIRTYRYSDNPHPLGICIREGHCGPWDKNDSRNNQAWEDGVI